MLLKNHLCEAVTVSQLVTQIKGAQTSEQIVEFNRHVSPRVTDRCEVTLN